MVGQFSTDYTGRQIDILTMDLGDNPGLFRPIRAGLRFSDPAKITAGVQQAVQSFVQLLFTRKGTVRNVDVGSDFLRLMTTRPPRNSLDVRNYYTTVAGDVVRQVNSGSAQPDERIQTAALLSATVTEDSVSLTVQIVTEVGQSVTFLTPIEGV